MKNKKSFKNKIVNNLILAGIDFLLLGFTYFIAVGTSHAMNRQITLENAILISLILIAISIISFLVLRLNKMILSHIGFDDVLKISVFIILKNTIFGLFFFIVDEIDYLPWQMFILISPLEFVLMLVPRASHRFKNYFIRTFEKREGIRTLIIGAGSGGTIVLKEINQNPELNYKVVGFIDDDENKIDSSLNGVKVYGPLKDIKNIIKKLNAEMVIIAIANLAPKRLSVLVSDLTEVNVKSKKIVVLSDLKEDNPVQIVDIKIEDLLNRAPVELDNKGLKDLIKDKVILVTGGGGSIGSELCRQIVQNDPKTLIIFDIYENSTYDIQMELMRLFYKNKDKKINLEVIIGSVYNEARVRFVLEKHRPNIIFHAAAYKHVPLMEDSPMEAIRTNVLGTYNVATLADEFKVDKMILVSTDKAVRPTNVMGATKRAAEHIIQYQNSIAKHTSYSAVRFGNVLGSSGSVIPLFSKQIADGGPLTVTHKEITRFFMTIPEAVSLILLSGVYAKGGEIFVLDMGEPVKILDLAERMIRLVGYKPYEDIDIEFVGLRPGEKLYEEILIDTNLDIHKPTPNSKIFIEHESFLSFEELKINQIKTKLDSLNEEQVIKELKSVIKTYKDNKEVNEK